MIEYFHDWKDDEGYKAWLDSLQPGDTWTYVYTSGYSSRRDVATVTVKKLTKTQIVLLDGTRYRRSDGGKVGGSFYDKLHGPSRPEELQKAADEREHRWLAAQLDGVKWKNIVKEKLEAVLKIIKED
jgi:hypothetical protein